jgi:hypothetical protein
MEILPHFYGKKKWQFCIFQTSRGVMMMLNFIITLVCQWIRTSVQSEDGGDNGWAIDDAKDGYPNAVNEVPVHFNRLDGEDSLSGEVTTQSTQPAN